MTYCTHRKTHPNNRQPLDPPKHTTHSPRCTTHTALPARAKSQPHSLSLPCPCLCLSLVLLWWLQTPVVCLCSGQAQAHLPSSTRSRQWLSKTCQPARTLCRIPGWTAHTNVTCKKSCTHIQFLKNFLRISNSRKAGLLLNTACFMNTNISNKNI